MHEEANFFSGSHAFSLLQLKKGSIFLKYEYIYSSHKACNTRITTTTTTLTELAFKQEWAKLVRRFLLFKPNSCEGSISA